jgi:hypothetical protein
LFLIRRGRGILHDGYIPSISACISRVLKNRASRRDPALFGFCKCSHMTE